MCDSKRYREEYKDVNSATQVIDILVAKPLGMAADVLEYIRSIKDPKNGYNVLFSQWQMDGAVKTASGTIRVHRPDGEFFNLPLKLMITNKECYVQNNALFLKDEIAPKYNGTYSLRELSFNVIPIGSHAGIRTEIRTTHIRTIGDSILATWVIRGLPWIKTMREIPRKQPHIGSVRRPKRLRRLISIYRGDEGPHGCY